MRLPYRKGVGAVLFNDRGRVFVARRIDTTDEAACRKTSPDETWPRVTWQMPQGGIDDGEDPRQAVFRELAEETGTDKAVIIAETEGWLTYDLPADLVGRVWGGRFRGQEQKWFALRFTGADDDIDLEAHHRPEFSQWKWACLAETANLIVPFKRALYTEIAAEFGALAKPVGGETERDRRRP